MTFTGIRFLKRLLQLLLKVMPFFLVLLVVKNGITFQEKSVLSQACCVLEKSWVSLPTFVLPLYMMSLLMPAH